MLKWHISVIGQLLFSLIAAIMNIQRNSIDISTVRLLVDGSVSLR